MTECKLQELNTGCIMVNNKIPFNEITFPFDVTGLRIFMQMRMEMNSQIVFAFDTLDGSIVQVDTNKIVIKSRKANLPIGVYYGDLAIEGLDVDQTILFEPYRRKIKIINSFTRPTS